MGGGGREARKIPPPTRVTDPPRLSFVEALEQLNVTIHRLAGQRVDDNESAEQIAHIFRQAKSGGFRSISQSGLRDAFEDLHDTLEQLDLDVLVHMLHRPNREVHDHYLSDLARLAGVDRVVLEVRSERGSEGAKRTRRKTRCERRTCERRCALGC